MRRTEMLQGLREMKFEEVYERFRGGRLFCSLYTDRGSHYFHTPKAGEPVSKTVLTEVGRALEGLGIRHIAAYSPEARGRSERLFETLQDRLVKELADAGIDDIETANRFIRETYLPAHNRRFMVEAAEAGSAFIAWRREDLDEILCCEEERVVDRDNSVAFARLKLQIEPSPPRRHFVRATVKVRRYVSGEIGLFYGPRCIGRYGPSKAAWHASTPRNLIAGACPRRSNQERSGQLTCHQNRTS